MIEAVMIWNEPNNLSHWDFEMDPDWTRFAEMSKLAADAIASEAPAVTKVLGGISPIDARFKGLLREDGSPKRALQTFARHPTDLGICQWFHFEDPRLDLAVRWLERLGVTRLRTGLSWADAHGDRAMAWFDRQMRALEKFCVTVTCCFTPPNRGLRPDHTSPPQDPREFADFCARITRRYVR